MNSLTIYMIYRFGQFPIYLRLLFEGLYKTLERNLVPSLWKSLVHWPWFWLFLYFYNQKKIFLKLGKFVGVVSGFKK